MRPTPWPCSARRRRRGPRAGSFGRRRAAAPSPASAGGLGAAGRLQSSSGLPRRNEVLLRSAGAQGPEQCVCPLGKVPNVSKRAGKQESEWCSGVAWNPWVAPRGGVYDPVSSRAEDGELGTAQGGSYRRGRASPARTVPGFLSGLATPRVPSLSNSSSRRSQDLGVKVRRKKSYHVSTFQWAGPPPPPIHYLLCRPGGSQ